MEPIPPEKKRAITGALLRWFSKNRRDFPWRNTFEKPDPYVILFTEVMLQRTRANQVAPVYSEFFERYPTFDSLAKAPEKDIVAFFLRLGLKWRARNVVRLVRTLVREHRGIVPREFRKLEKLPAVGDYVAKAVSCYAYGERVAPVDANVVRVISRLFGIVISGDSARRSKRIAQLTLSLIPAGKVRDFNLALLDFAAAVCKPNPVCEICPLQGHCDYYANVKKTIQPASS